MKFNPIDNYAVATALDDARDVMFYGGMVVGCVLAFRQMEHARSDAEHIALWCAAVMFIVLALNEIVVRTCASILSRQLKALEALEASEAAAQRERKEGEDE